MASTNALYSSSPRLPPRIHVGSSRVPSRSTIDTSIYEPSSTDSQPTVNKYGSYGSSTHMIRHSSPIRRSDPSIVPSRDPRGSFTDTMCRLGRSITDSILMGENKGLAQDVDRKRHIPDNGVVNLSTGHLFHHHGKKRIHPNKPGRAKDQKAAYSFKKLNIKEAIKRQLRTTSTKANSKSRTNKATLTGLASSKDPLDMETERKAESSIRGNGIYTGQIPRPNLSTEKKEDGIQARLSLKIIIPKAWRKEKPAHTMHSVLGHVSDWRQHRRAKRKQKKTQTVFELEAVDVPVEAHTENEIAVSTPNREEGSAKSIAKPQASSTARLSRNHQDSISSVDSQILLEKIPKLLLQESLTSGKDNNNIKNNRCDASSQTNEVPIHSYYLTDYFDIARPMPSVDTNDLTKVALSPLVVALEERLNKDHKPSPLEVVTRELTNIHLSSPDSSDTTNDSDTPKYSHNSNTSNEETQSSRAINSLSSSGKRTWSKKDRHSPNDDGEDDDDIPERKRPRKPRESSERTADLLNFACPFRKHMPSKYGLRNERYHSCATGSWRDMSHLKEHIYRVHAAKCTGCKSVLRSQEDMEDHINFSTCRVFTDEQVDGLYGESIKALKGLKAGKGGRRQSWETVYRLLFPDERTVPDPWYVPICDNQCQVSDDEVSGKSFDEAMSGEEIASTILSRILLNDNDILSRRPEIARLLIERINARYSESTSVENDKDFSIEDKPPGIIIEEQNTILEPTATISTLERNGFIAEDNDISCFDQIITHDPRMNIQMSTHNTTASYEVGWGAGHQEGYLEGQKEGYRTGFAAAKKAAERGIHHTLQGIPNNGGSQYQFSKSSIGEFETAYHPQIDMSNTSRTTTTSILSHESSANNSCITPHSSKTSTEEDTSVSEEIPEQNEMCTTSSSSNVHPINELIIPDFDFGLDVSFDFPLDDLMNCQGQNNGN